MAAFITDGDFTLVVQQTPWRKTFPFEGDFASFIVEADFMQLFSSFAPLAADVENPDIAACYLVKETPLQDLGGGVARWSRIYAKIPAQRIDYESFAWQMPGIAQGSAGSVKAISGNVGVNSAAITTFTTAAVHGFAANDRVVINYTVMVNGLYYISRRVLKTVLTVPTTTTFTVDQITDVSAPYYFYAVKVSPGRDPITRVVDSKLQLDYYLPGVTGGTTTPADIPILSPTIITDSDGKDVASYDYNTTPTIGTYNGTLGTYIVGEASSLRRWMGNIYERTTRYVVAA